MRTAYLTRCRPWSRPTGLGPIRTWIDTSTSALPQGVAVEQWTTTRHHLREITHTDVDASLRPLRGHPRYNAISALRALFRYAKRKSLVFVDPTRH